MELSPQKNAGLFRKLQKILAGPKLWLEPAEAFGGRYILLRIEESRHPLDWTAIEEICGRFSDRLLLPDCIPTPENSGIRPPRMEAFETQVLIRTVCEMISMTDIPMYRRVLGFIDPDARWFGMLSTLLKYYTSVRVYTRNTNLYENVRLQMMEELGAPIFISDSLSSMSCGCALIVSPGALYCGESDVFSCPLVAGDVIVYTGKCDVITGLHMKAGPELLSVCPRGIDPHRFAGALFEYCGVMPESFIAEEMLCNYKTSDLTEAVRLITLNAKQNAAC